MAKVLVTDTYLSNIADAIRAKNGGSATYTPGQMAGAIAALPDAPVLVDKTIIQNGTYNASDDSADGYSQVVVNVPSGGGASIEEWDLTDSFVGTKRGVQLTVGNVVISSSGAVFDSVSDYLTVRTFPAITVELDVSSMVLTSGSTHRRFVMTGNSATGGADNGLIYEYSGVWGFYNGSWENSNISDGSYFDNCTVKIQIDSDGQWHIYRNNILVWEPTKKLVLNTWLLIGANSSSIDNAVISGMRLY